MKIKFVEHAKERMKERGTSEEEVKEVLLLGADISAKKVVITVKVFYGKWR
jgi:hypothetical protein